ncbi:DUF4488 domain-containing protein [Paludibacter sp. 221]|uniref:DUF4488 domain-containing protein n=1 Tax=Paludibacter sp. 221 TaxID=2302939 RepID=UPI0013D50F28|nr:DUF4488 domain-containing protein [Paludibacter sp. 221]
MKQPELGKKIAELRKAKGLTQEELSKQCNLNIRSLQRIESGEATPRFYTLKMIFNALDYSVEDFNTLGQQDQLKEDAVNQQIEEQHSFFSKLSGFFRSLSLSERILVISFFVVIISLIIVVSAIRDKNVRNDANAKNGVVWVNDLKTTSDPVTTMKAFDIQGVWQLSKDAIGKEALLKGSVPNVYSTYKFIDKCGNFTNMIRNNKGTHITADGKYSISETEYIEYVDRSFTSPSYSASDNRMKYEIIQNKYLILVYVKEGNKFNELWVKVPYGNPMN